MSGLNETLLPDPDPQATSGIDARGVSLADGRPVPDTAVQEGILRRCIDLMGAHAPLAFAAAAIAFWVALAIVTQTSLRGDNVEQTVWMHSLEWGYYKHPPLTTWLLIAVAGAIGPHWWLTSVLGGLCLLGTALATYAVALLLVPRRVAHVAIVLWGLHLTLTWRADLYNHNSVLMLVCGWLAWAVIVATRKQELRYWLLAGALAGAAMLAKYQAAVIFVVLAFVLARAGHLGQAPGRRGMIAGSLLALGIFAPHFAWLATHEFAPLHYAGKHLHGNWTLFERGTVIGFAAQQVRFFWPALAAALVCAVIFRPIAHTSSEAGDASAADARRNWVRALTFGPILIVLAFGLAGARLQNHWGMQALQFVSIGLASWLCRRSAVRLHQLMLVALALHCVLVATALRDLARVHESGWDGRGDGFYPGRQLADRAVADWKAATSCPLRYVVGPQFEAGSIALFSGSNPLVFESGSLMASPWIDPRDVQRRGAIHVAAAAEELPRETAWYGDLEVTTAGQSKRSAIVHWGVVLPEVPCDAVLPVAGSQPQ